MTATDSPDWQRVVALASSGMTQDAPDWQRVVVGVPTSGAAHDAPDWEYTVVGPGGSSVVPPPAGTPTSGMFAWYDASKITGVADNSALATWDDLSGNGYTLTANGDPTYYSATAEYLVNGLPAVWFNANASMQNSVMAPGALTTFFLVAFNTTNTPTAFMFDGYDSSNRQGAFCNSNEFAAPLFIEAPSSIATSAPYPTTACETTIQFNDTNNASLVRQNGVLQTSGINAGGGELAGITVGNAYALSGNGMQGPICEFLLYASLLTDAEMAATEAYLIAKWLG